MPRSLAYSLAFLASSYLVSGTSGIAFAQQAQAEGSAPVRVRFSGDAVPAAANGSAAEQGPSRSQYLLPGELQPLPPRHLRGKPAVILPAAAKMGPLGSGLAAQGASSGCTAPGCTTGSCDSPNWTDSCVHCGSMGCDGYGCGFGECVSEPTRFAPGGFWVKAEYLYWRISGNNVPALVTASPFGTDEGEVGVLPEARVLFGNEPIADDFRSGGRIQAGLWLDDAEKWGIQGDFAALADDGTDFFVESDGSEFGLGRPFFNVDPNNPGEDAFRVAFDFPNGDDGLDGFISVESSSDFYTGGMLLRRRLSCGACSRWDFLVGYRLLKLDEALVISDQSTDVDGAINPAGTVISTRDAFSADNEFHGVDLGVAASFDMGKWALEGTVKCALGNNQQTVTIAGQSTVDFPGFPPVSNNTGVLTQTSNIGNYERDQFAVVPEARASASYFITDHIRVTGGYNMIYVDTVVRPGDQIDRVVNGSFLEGGGPFSGPARPTFQFNDSKVFIHGANVSLDIMF